MTELRREQKVDKQTQVHSILSDVEAVPVCLTGEMKAETQG